MPVRLPNASRSAACDAVVDLADGGTPPAKIRVYTGSQPADPNSPTAETLLVEFTLSNPAFSAASNGVATLNGTPIVAAALATGTAGWFRLVQGGAAAGAPGVLDGEVGAVGSGKQMQLSTTSITSGVNVQLTSGTVTMPQGSS